MLQFAIITAALPLSLLAVVLTAFHAYSVLTDYAVHNQSVEVGLAELSPRGETGGVAVPASGGSNPGCVGANCQEVRTGLISQTCNSDGSVQINWVPPGNGSCRGHGYIEGVYYQVLPNVVSVPSAGQGNQYIEVRRVERITTPGPESPNGASWNMISCEWVTDTHRTRSCPLPSPPTCSISVSPTTLPYPGGNVTLTWNSQDASSATINNGVGAVSGSDSRSVYVNSSRTYTMTVSNAAGSASCSTAAITVEPPQCNDGIDNDGDGNVDYGSDTGCTSRNDNEELQPEMDMTACRSDRTCVGDGGTLYISPTDEVTINWSSSDVDSCSSVGAESIPMGSDSTSGTNVNVDEPAAGTSGTYSIACGNGGVAQVQESITVIYPDVSLAYRPTPPIVPHDGMPPGNPATITPIIDGFNENLCYITGPNVPTNNSVPALVDASGDYAVTLNEEGESTYTISCYYDQNADGAADSTPPMQDTATFRMLPEIQET